MGKFTYENQGSNTFFVYAMDPQEELDTMTLGMLTNNKIPGLASCLFLQVDDTKFIKYNVSAKVSVKQFFTGVVNKKRLLGVFSGIADAMMAAEEYMIDPNSIMLDLEYIFADVSTCDTVLICQPVIQENAALVDLGMFFKNIMFSTQFDQTENCDYIARIINYLNSAAVFSLADFKTLMDDLKGSPAAAYAKPAYQPPVQPMPAPKPVQQPPAVQQPPVVQQPVAPQPSVQQAPAQRPPVQQVPPQRPPVQQPPVQRPPVQQVPPQPAQKKAPVQSAPNPGFAVPGAPQRPGQQNAAKPANAPASGAPEKEISFMYLMQHYNKENAAMYKAQQEAKKQNKAAAAPNKNKKGVQNPPMPMPGQAPGYPMPGQAPAQNAGYSVPGAPQRPMQQPGQAPGYPMPGQKPQAPVQQPPVQRPAPQPPVQKPVQQPPVYTPPVIPQTQGMNFGDTTVLGGGGMGETTVLGTTSTDLQFKPQLLRARNNERITIDKPVFRIGKERSYVDYFIGDNTAISRSHANIITREGEYFIVDTNSTNHTYVNGVMLQSNEETKLSHGAKIRLANEDFEFKLY